MGKYFDQALGIVADIAASAVTSENPKKEKKQTHKDRNPSFDRKEQKRMNKENRKKNKEWKKSSGVKMMGSVGKNDNMQSSVESDSDSRYVSEGTPDVSKGRKAEKKSPAKNYKKGYYSSPAKMKAPLKKSSSPHKMGGMSFIDGQSPMKKMSAVSASPLKEPVTLALISAGSLIVGGIMDYFSNKKANKRDDKIRAEENKIKAQNRAGDMHMEALSGGQALHANRSASFLSKMK